jgi:energy-coupling factor transport system substrate-specific component
VRARKRVSRLRIVVLCAFGGGITFALYGILLDTAAAVMFTQNGFSVTTLLATYLTGIPFNAIHAVSTVIFLAILARPMIEKLERVKKKYGLYHGGGHA